MALLAHARPARLVVFVHGFRGGPVRTWREFGRNSSDPWWQESDLLFVGYDSVRENLTGVAARLRHELPRFFPGPVDGWLDDVPREATAPYGELVLVGHSLGGVILRRTLVDAAQEWQEQLASDPGSPMPSLLAAKTRLFSPASAGFRSAGALGLLQASPGWLGLNMVLRRSSAFVDLQPGSPILTTTQARTEALVGLGAPGAMEALRARILWANPDNIVNTERYESDFVDDAIDGRTHRDVCKPDATYDAPRIFVSHGSIR